MSELKEGVKIKIPKTKSYGCSIEASAAVLKAKREGLDHMYIDSVLTDRHDIDEVFGCGCHTGPSDYFLREDIEVYVEPTPPTQADRYNSGKAMFHLLSLEALEPCVRVLEFGAKKYSANNWKKGLVESEVIDSMLRHLKAVLEGEENDPESGLPHIGHVQCNAMFLGHSSLIKNMAGRA